MKQFGPRARRLAATQRRTQKEEQVSKKMLAVTFTDGRNSEVIAFDPTRDTEETVALLTDRMKENGWVPIKGSGRILTIENGVVSDFVAHPKMKPVWQVA